MACVEVEKAAKLHDLRLSVAECSCDEAAKFRQVWPEILKPDIRLYPRVQKVDSHCEERLGASPEVEEVSLAGERPVKAQVSHVLVRERQGAAECHLT